MKLQTSWIFTDPSYSVQYFPPYKMPVLNGCSGLNNKLLTGEMTL